ncbi:MAG: NAD-dependent epimerase/dehydratase family protein [Rhodospirillales bacterium]|nr:NAD-dependent epimerase/dehydratase family protein [Rhodospirillales bacterium]
MRQARIAWPDARVLVTGGAGFVGSHIVDLLADAGCRNIVVVDNMIRGRVENLDRAMARGGVQLVEGDIRDRQLMADLVEGANIVFHQAALRITHCAEDPRAAINVMADATFDLLELCVRNEIAKVVMASSASVYGMADAFPTDERHHPYNNRTLYGAAKAFAEGMLRSFNDTYGLNYVALRYFNVYGPRMDIHGRYTEVMIRWMERIEAGQPPIIFGDGLQTMDFVHVRDVARANLLAAEADASDVVYNIGSGTETSLAQVARSLTSAMGVNGLTPIYADQRAVNPVPRRLADVAAARRELGFMATIGFEAGLRELVDWWRQTQAIGSARVALPGAAA